MNQLLENLRKAVSLREKIRVLDLYPPVKEYLEKKPEIFQGFSSECEAAGKQLIAIGQWDRLVDSGILQKESLEQLLHKMAAFDGFYRELGGIVGYQERVLKFLEGIEDGRKSEIATLHPPSFIDIAEETDEVRDAIVWGINALPEMVEMYPLGGAADRLHLVDERTGSDLPAAKLKYAGKTLFEALIRDLSAREYLYFKLYGKQLETPVVIMTSAEKENHAHVLQICEEMAWFGRSKDRFRIFMQPLVPAIDSAGDWCLLGPGSPLLKPGGHGALWKLAHDEGVFSWLKSLGRKTALIRQLNNPIASLDYGLLAFVGIGVKQEMIFGFASCPRLLQSAEGVNVVIEKKNGEIALTNVEYCDFAKYGIEDQPLRAGEPYSRFSSNTNILFADLQTIADAVKECPFPGLLVNFKQASYTTLAGEKKQETIARLESTMQNIADIFVEKASYSESQKLKTKKTFITYNHRHKTIATAKKAFVSGRPLQETPEECFYVQMESVRELLSNHCHFSLPPRRSVVEYLEKGPDFVCLYHPGLGPLYSIVAQKIQRGQIALGSELQLEIADLEIKNLCLDGSLIVRATQPLGGLNQDGILRYSNSRTGRCSLKNVVVCNSGIDWVQSSPYWRNCPKRDAALEVVLNGFSEFVAEDVVFEGNLRFEVPEGIRMRVRQKNSETFVETEKLEDIPFWVYSFTERQEILAARGKY